MKLPTVCTEETGQSMHEHLVAPTARVAGPHIPGVEQVFTGEVLELLGDLHTQFDDRRRALVDARRLRHEEMARTGGLDFLEHTRHIREDVDWQVEPAPQDLVDRRVEITGPTDPKMAVNALNSGARVWLADLEDANTPHWANVVAGQVVLQAAARGNLRHQADEGTVYRLLPDADLATIVARPRGWHLDESHVLVNGQAISASIVDAALYIFHNAEALLERGSGPYLYIPKLEGHLEARLWRDVLAGIEKHMGLTVGTVRATVLIETFPAAFEMDEILHELRPHVTGLNAGRWDYLFSLIKLARHAGNRMTLPDRAQVTMEVPFMGAYTELLVRTCHRRGAHAIGGMSAFIPDRRDLKVTSRALSRVRRDKEREARQGFDGSWVAHPDLVPVCAETFTESFDGSRNQLHLEPQDDSIVTASDLINVTVPGGVVTREGVTTNVAVAVEYIAAWLGGRGAVAINNLMEDTATAEISRSQLWQWVATRTPLADGGVVDGDLVRTTIGQQVTRLSSLTTDPSVAERVHQAAALLETVALAPEFVDFITQPAYELIRSKG